MLNRYPRHLFLKSPRAQVKVQAQKPENEERPQKGALVLSITVEKEIIL